MRGLLLAAAVALSAIAYAPSAAAAPLPEVCSSALKPGSDCEGTVCVTWDGIPWMGGCAFEIRDPCDYLVLCQPCTCPPIQSSPEARAFLA